MLFGTSLLAAASLWCHAPRHDDVRLAGFSDISLEELRAAQADFVKERDWEQFHTPRSLALAMVGEVGELCELLQWRGDDGAPPDDDARRSRRGRLAGGSMDRAGAGQAPSSFWRGRRRGGGGGSSWLASSRAAARRARTSGASVDKGGWSAVATKDGRDA